MKNPVSHTLTAHPIGTFVLLTIIWTIAATAGRASEPFFLWIEAENFTTATQSIKTVHSSYALITPEQERSGASFLERSGWSVDASQKVSGDGYIEQTAGDRMIPEAGEYVSYEFQVPSQDDYRIWIRCHSPPPCARYFNIWFDVPRPGEAKRKLNFSFYNVWSWWPWGEGEFNTGKAMAIRLAAGRHVLHVGNISRSLKIDKLLITNDAAYVPSGANQHYFNGTFEPERIIDVHGWHQTRAHQDAKATGWEASPAGRWEIREDALKENHYYYAAAAQGATSPTLPSRALIKDLTCAYFEARWCILRPADVAAATGDAALVFGYQDPAHYWAIRFTPSQAALWRADGSEPKPLRTVPCSMPSRAEPYKIAVRRGRDSVAVTAEGKSLLSARLAAMAAGGIGVQSASGGVGFDDVTVESLDDPSASFDFTALSDPAFADWTTSGEAVSSAQALQQQLRSGQVVSYRVPYWSNSALQIELEPRAASPFSVYFPYAGPDDYIQTHITGSKEPSLEIIRRHGGQTVSRGKIPLQVQGDSPTTLTMQSVKGLFTISLGQQRLFEMNEYEILEGTVGLAAEEAGDQFPIRRLRIEPRDMIHDDFPLTASGALEPGWSVEQGRWKVGMGLEGQTAEGDGQLIATGPGEVLIGDDRWRQIVMQVNASFEQGAALALVGWAYKGQSVELYCAAGKIQLRKVADGAPMVLAEAPAAELTSGWHRLGLDLEANGIAAEVDGKRRLSVEMQGLRGRAGLRNEGALAAFDNLTIQVLSKDKSTAALVKPVDPTLVEIGESLTR